VPFWEHTRQFLKELSESVRLVVSTWGACSYFEYGDQRKVLNRYDVP
jgi:hypothetical protein